MNTHTTIVAGIDFSDSSTIVLRHTIHAAGSRDANVIAMHVLDESNQSLRSKSGLKNPDFETLKSQADDKFDKLLSEMADGVHVEFIVKIGKPAEELNRIAEDMNASFMVISANDLTKERLGSVASRCVRTAPCDVLILRDWQGGPFRKIVACTDFSQTADRAIDRAASVARQDGAALEILTVVYPPNLDSWGAVLEHPADSATSYAEECSAAVNQKMKECLERHQTALDGVKHESVILESQIPSVKITGYVRSAIADLVVMGTHGHSAIASHFIGTNAERLIHDAPVSVFAVR